MDKAVVLRRMQKYPKRKYQQGYYLYFWIQIYTRGRGYIGCRRRYKGFRISSEIWQIGDTEWDSLPNEGWRLER